MTPNDSPPPETATVPPSPKAPSLSGGKVLALVGAGLLLIAGTLAVLPRNASRPQAEVGREVTAAITLVTSDRKDVQCLSQAAVEPFHCSYVDESTKWRGVDKDTLRPFMTTDRQLYLIPGLFTHPALNERYHADPPHLPRAERQRFTASCTLKIIGTLSGFRVRWEETGTWGDPHGETPVASVVDCRIEP